MRARESGSVEREKEKSKRREEGGEGEANTWNPDWNFRGTKTPGMEHPGGGGPGLERQGKQRPGIGTFGAARGGGYSSGDERRGSHEQGQGPDEEGYDERESGSGRGRSRWKSGQTRLTQTGTTREAVHQDWNIRGRGGPGWERPGLQEEDETATARNGKESKYKNRGRGRTTTRRASGEKREEKEKNERRMGTWNPTRVARATRQPQGTKTAWEAAQERGAGAGGERPVLGAQNGPRMEEDPVGPRVRVAGGPVGYKHRTRDGMGPQNSPGD